MKTKLSNNINRVEEYSAIEVCGIIVEPTKIKSTALKNIVSEMAKQDEADLVSCRHDDWSQQAQCGCVSGCLLS